MNEIKEKNNILPSFRHHEQDDTHTHTQIERDQLIISLLVVMSMMVNLRVVQNTEKFQLI